MTATGWRSSTSWAAACHPERRDPVGESERACSQSPTYRLPLLLFQILRKKNVKGRRYFFHRGPSTPLLSAFDTITPLRMTPPSGRKNYRPAVSHSNRGKSSLPGNSVSH